MSKEDLKGIKEEYEHKINNLLSELCSKVPNEWEANIYIENTSIKSEDGEWMKEIYCRIKLIQSI